MIEDGRIVRLAPANPGSTSRFWNQWGRLVLPLPLWIELDTGAWVASAALPDFVLRIAAGDNGADAMFYQSMFDPVVSTSAKFMAEMRVRGLAGEQVPEVVQALRASKHADPMLGVLAAWLHYGVGDLSNIYRTAYYFSQQNQPIPFDVALLGRLPAAVQASGEVSLLIPAVDEADGMRSLPLYMRGATPHAVGVLGGSVPFLRQGWKLLKPEGAPGLYPPALAELADYLLPSPFTTLSAEGGVKLAKLALEGF
ncbi:hypothetical protein [Muricoccus radiodurans]|uniref:hypothetical protein n=1 Tax=Muricoccus radiodurans TaxID=2231721 RepID=UPI003CF76409